MNNLVSNHNASDLAQRWEKLRNEQPGIRIREAATALKASEAALLATTIGTECVRLAGPWPDFLKRLADLGRVMALTRNGSCILEHKGVIENIHIIGSNGSAMATTQGPIEARMFFKDWHVAFAVQQKKEDRTLTSFQVFDKAGHAITKIYLQEGSNWDVFEKIGQDFQAEDQSPDQSVTPYAPVTYATTVDEEKFLQDWAALKDTHDFFPMLKDYNLSRHHAIRLAEGKFSRRVALASIQQLLEEAAATKLPIMIFAGNRGNIQIHHGPVKTIRFLARGHGGAERWLNILDPDFNMHLRMDYLESAWAVTKPTDDGEVHSIEVFDQDQQLVVQFFGLRKPGIKELDEWKALVEKLPGV